MFLKYLVSVSLMLYVTSLYGQDGSKRNSKCNIDVDSLFQTHFISLDTTIKCNTTKKFPRTEDVKFVMLIGFLSGIDFGLHSYTGQPQLNYDKVLEYKIWYRDYRKKIKCESVKRGLQLLETDLITEETINNLEKLKIK